MSRELSRVCCWCKTEPVREGSYLWCSDECMELARLNWVAWFEERWRKR